MATHSIVGQPTDLLHSGEVHNRNQRPSRRPPTSQGKNIRSQDTLRLLNSYQPLGKSNPTPKSKSKSKSRRPNKWQRHTHHPHWKLPLLLITLILSLYALNPTESNITHPLLFLSYKVPNNLTTTTASEPAKYTKGPLDIAFVAFYTLVLFTLRSLTITTLLHPLAQHLGIPRQNTSKQTRFTEQAYVALYTGLAGPAGLYVMYAASPAWYFDTVGLYAGYPHTVLEGVAKAYYLLQAAFWVMQALVMVLGLEGRRRDFRELVVHHCVTVALVALSYRFHFTVMGVLVYVTHDISDFFLATSKSLNYIDSPWQGPYYTLCIISWVYLRHYINLKILLSVLTEFRTIGPYVLDWDAEQFKCDISAVITFSLLAALQALNLFWLYCLLRNGYRFVVLGIAKDDREEDEDMEVDRLGEVEGELKKI